MSDCPTCHRPTPAGGFCVRCGAPQERALPHPRGRSQYAAAPAQGRHAPWLISTLFPQLPRHSERHFRIAVLTGAALVGALAGLGLFAIALICAALLMPLVTLLYFYDVDVYRDEPGRAAGATVLWGALAGTGVGLLARVLAPSGATLISRSASHEVLLLGLLLPAVGVGLMLCGPLALVRSTRYDDALDGAQFGAGTAVTFSAAQAIVVGTGVLGDGLRQPGAVFPWVERLLALAVATPVLSMCALGFASAAVWVRFRAPETDRDALGPLGRVPVAVTLALSLVVAGAITQTFMSVGLWLAWLAVLDLVGLVLLREALHVGLLQEAGEREIGAEIRCANCGETTAQHTFCGACGIALGALPARARGGEQEQGAFGGRLRHGRRRLLVGAGLLLASAGAAVAVAALAAPSAPAPRCRRALACGSPPVAHGLVRTQALSELPGYSGWQSSGLGYTLRFNQAQWTIASQSATDLVLGSEDGRAQLSFHGAPAAQFTPRTLLAARVKDLSGQLLGLSADTSAADQILGPNLGLVPGAASVQRGTTNTPQGPETPMAVTLLAAGQGAVALVATVVTPAGDPAEQSTIFGRADDILNSIGFPGQ